ncbi:alpha-N-arabinofuranosidase [Novosphingobium umbonatum]|uniref:non-reducing end alpha-L-arabinofuranosidase n=2 Tax=Novosphingobium umbonatum TaxID=1908524 RepID=A0A3S3TPW7_9SPHN|nr:alpha-N-arabinofuranosidase [Novosphingobium umbonatum]RVU05891.1 alpha-N-arabinofuranosidase [Novosphingobium umbonatum]
MAIFRHGLAAVLLLSSATQALAQAAPQSAEATLHAEAPAGVYDRHIFTQFAEHLGTGIYGGLWVGKDSPIPNTRGFRNDVVAALKALKVPTVRWPGGCFADEYHWREGIGEQAKRPVKVNTHWGGVTEPNTVGTHEFMDLVEQLGAEPYIAGNVGNGTVREMAEWVEYMTAPAGSLAEERAANGHKAPWAVPYFGVGNELWGCGGNMRPEFAADETRRYATFVKAPSGTRIIKIASGANVDDYGWTEAMMKIAANQVDGLSLHYYTMPGGGWPPRTSATQFNEDGWAETLSEARRMDELITKHSAIMDKYDPKKRVFLAVDEWGTWFTPEPSTNPGFLYQQNTLRDALVAAVHLNLFAKHVDRVKMTAIAQMVNVLQTMILTDGAKMVLTPTYHVFSLYKPWQDATVLPIEVKAPDYKRGAWTMPAISASAVKGKDGHIHVALANLDPNRAMPVSIALGGVKAGKVAGQILTAPAMNTMNTFAAPQTLVPVPFKGASIKGATLSVTMPAKSVVVLDLD